MQSRGEGRRGKRKEESGGRGEVKYRVAARLGNVLLVFMRQIASASPGGLCFAWSAKPCSCQVAPRRNQHRMQHETRTRVPSGAGTKRWRPLVVAPILARHRQHEGRRRMSTIDRVDKGMLSVEGKVMHSPCDKPGPSLDRRPNPSIWGIDRS
jgi:hypothetical protein